uniref:Snake toxin/toxin-like domain-containing protein n=1 Tax=Gopherus evgoodei TaxID=1825980 RepID=A0A8C5F059_9SAUR
KLSHLALALASSHSLMCYTCQGETSNKYCMKISMCAKEDNYCVTIKDVVGAGTSSGLTDFQSHPW